MSKMWNSMNCDDGGCKLLVISSSNVRQIKLPWCHKQLRQSPIKILHDKKWLSSLADKRVRDHLHGAGMQILTKQCEDEHDKEVSYGPVSLALKRVVMWTGIACT